MGRTSEHVMKMTLKCKDYKIYLKRLAYDKLNVLISQKHSSTANAHVNMWKWCCSGNIVVMFRPSGSFYQPRERTCKHTIKLSCKGKIVDTLKRIAQMNWSHGSLYLSRERTWKHTITRVTNLRLACHVRLFEGLFVVLDKFTLDFHKHFKTKLSKIGPAVLEF